MIKSNAADFFPFIIRYRASGIAYRLKLSITNTPSTNYRDGSRNACFLVFAIGYQDRGRLSIQTLDCDCGVPDIPLTVLLVPSLSIGIAYRFRPSSSIANTRVPDTDSGIFCLSCYRYSVSQSGIVFSFFPKTLDCDCEYPIPIAISSRHILFRPSWSASQLTGQA
jgi:hypothetical protein